MAKTDSRGRKWEQKKYPYKIPVYTGGEPSKEISTWRKLEFLRIEALLRSEKVHKIFEIRDKKESHKTLFREYGLDWSMLQGDHYKFLDPTKKDKDFCEPSPIIDPVTDVNAYLRNRSTKGTKNLLKIWENMMLKKEFGNIMLFQINTAYSPETIIKILRPLLKVAHEKSTTVPISPYHMYIKKIDGDIILGKVSNYAFPEGLPTRSVTAWLKSFSYYDLYQSDNKSHGDIASILNRDSDNKGSIPKDITQARTIIKEAENWDWPPKKI